MVQARGVPPAHHWNGLHRCCTGCGRAIGNDRGLTSHSSGDLAQTIASGSCGFFHAELRQKIDIDRRQARAANRPGLCWSLARQCTDTCELSGKS